MHRAAVLILAALAFAGCSFIPAPYTRDRAAALDRAEARTENARTLLVRLAQWETEVAALALRQAPPSPAVTVAQDATAAAQSLQANAAGPLPEAKRQEAQTVAAGLVAQEPAAIEARAEHDQDNAQAVASFNKTEAKTQRAVEKLADGYAEERRLAGMVRKFVWGCLALGLLALVAGALAIYAKMTFGGTLGAVVAGLERFKKAAPSQADTLDAILGRVMDSAHKKTIRQVKATAQD